MNLSLKSKIFIYIILIFLSFYALFPVLWMIITSLKYSDEVFKIPITWIPERITFTNYLNIWKIQPLGRYFLNSIIASVSTVILTIIVGSMAAYAFARFRLKIKELILSIILITQMIPGVLLIIPYFNLMRYLNLLNSYPALILAYTAGTLPVVIWMLRGYFSSIPKEIDDAASIDGCSRFGVFFRIILPLSIPSLISTGIFVFLVSWSEYLFPLVLMTNKKMFVLTVGISSLIGQYRISWNELMAAGIIAILPIVLIFVFLDRFLIEGLTRGATIE